MIGIDIINIDDLPKLNSKIETQFFIDNYTKNEIEYVSNISNKQQAFAVLFSLKESILKCDNSYIDIPFNKINITMKNTKACYRGFSLTYSSLKSRLIITTASKVIDVI